MWGLHNITSRDPAVRRPLGEGIVILFFGCTVSIFLYFGANSLRSRRLSANAEHLHGSARWATEKDIRETGLLDARQGLYVGGWKPKRRSRLMSVTKMSQSISCPIVLTVLQGFCGSNIPGFQYARYPRSLNLVLQS